MRDTEGYSPTLDADLKLPANFDQTPDATQEPKEYEVASLTEVHQAPQGLKQLTEEGLRNSRVEETETKILEAVGRHNLPPELQVQIINSSEMNGILGYLGQVPSQKEAAAIVNQVVTELAAKQRQKLEALGLSFYPDNTLVLDEAATDAQSYDNVRRGLENLHWLTEAAHSVIAKPTKKDLEHVQPSAETITDHVYTDLLKLGVDAGTVQNALSHDLLDELEHTDYMTGKTDVILGAIDKVIRKLENNGGFKLDLYGDPQPVGGLNWLKNKLSFGRRADKQKSSREYRDIVALQALRDAVTVETANNNTVKYPAPKSLADMAARTAPAKAKKPISQSRQWATGFAGITAAGTIAGAYNESPARDTHEAATVSAAQPTTEAAKPEVQDGVYQFPEITIAPQKLEESVTRSRRSADFAPARAAEVEVASQNRRELETASPARSIEDSLAMSRADIDTSIAQPEKKSSRRVTLEAKPKTKKVKSTIRPLNNFANNIAKAKKEAAKAREARTEARKLVDTMIPKNEFDNVVNKELAPKQTGLERALKAKEKAEEIVKRVKAKRAQAAEASATTPDTVAPAKGLMAKVESSLQNKFGPDAERYLKALPSDVRIALGEMSPAQARALLSDKIATIPEDPNITAERITALHAAKKALEDSGESVSNK